MGHEFASCWAETLDLADSLQALIPDPIGENLIARAPHLLDLGSVTITAVVYRSTSGKSTDP